MEYDIAAKVILSHCQETVIDYFLGIKAASSTIVDLPQENVTLRRADHAVRLVTDQGEEQIVLIEVQSHCEPSIPLRVLQYEVWYRLKYGLPVVACVLLLTRSNRAVDTLTEGTIRYRYRLVRIWEHDGSDVLDKGLDCLAPFVPLMRGGLDKVEEAEGRLYQGDFSRKEKGDLLTGMAILTGLVSTEMAKSLIAKRRDIMIESAAYEMIKKEGYDEGIQ
jgi:hypothetical protein